MNAIRVKCNLEVHCETAKQGDERRTMEPAQPRDCFSWQTKRDSNRARETKDEGANNAQQTHMEATNVCARQHCTQRKRKHRNSPAHKQLNPKRNQHTAQRDANHEREKQRKQKHPHTCAKHTRSNEPPFHPTKEDQNSSPKKTNSTEGHSTFPSPPNTHTHTQIRPPG